MTGSSSAVVTFSNPFVGPRPIDTGQKIFGRDREIEELYYLLSAERIVLLHSPSGAGKSSLIQAGLVPRLGELFDVWGPTRVNIQPPDRDLESVNRYVQSANLGFEAGIPKGRQRLPELISTMTLFEYVANRPRRRSAPPNIVLIFDQFEEILTVEPLALQAKHAFFDQLGKLLRDPHIWALFALREDYLAPLDPYAELVPTHLKNLFRLDLLTRDAASEAISRSVEEVGRHFAPDAVEKLVNDLATMQVQRPDGTFQSQTGPFVEPLYLQVACRGLWEQMPEEKLTIDVDNIQSFANVTKALAEYYEREVSGIAGSDPREERAIREWVGDKLITPEGIRGQILKGAGQSENLDNKLIARLVDTHLVRAEQRAGAVWYELSHDRLIEPVRASNKTWFEAHLSKLQKVATVWEAQGRPEGLLLLGADLVEARQWAEKNESSVTDLERRFLEASEAKQDGIHRERRQARRVRLALGVAIVLLFIASFEFLRARDSAGVAELRATEAHVAEKKATDEASALAAEANALESSRSDALAEAKRATGAEQEANEKAREATAAEKAAKDEADEAQRQKIKAQHEKAQADWAKAWLTEAGQSSGLSSHLNNGKSIELYYVSNRHIYELWSWLADKFDGWHPADITRLNGQWPLAAVGSPLAGFYDDVAKTDAVFYVGETDQHIHEMLFKPSAVWTGIDVTTQPVGPGSTLTAHINPIAESEEVFFVNSDGAIQEMSSPRMVTPNWTTSNLFSGIVPAPKPADPKSPLIATFDSLTNPRLEELYYVGTDGQFHELQSAKPGSWSWIARP
jgi:flagellar biosynthesis GTPase FlhF